MNVKTDIFTWQKTGHFHVALTHLSLSAILGLFAKLTLNSFCAISFFLKLEKKDRKVGISGRFKKLKFFFALYIEENLSD